MKFHYSKSEMAEMILLFILLFSSISMISFYVIKYSGDFNEIKIGFPLKYFKQFNDDSDIIKSSWNFYYFLIDFFAILITSMYLYKFIRLKNIHKFGFIRILVLITIYSILIFYTLSYVGFIKGALNYSDYSIGLPLNYYWQFWLSGNYFPNHGTIIKNILIDSFVIWICIAIFTVIYKYSSKRS